MPRNTGIGMRKAKKKKIPLPEVAEVIAEAKAALPMDPEPPHVDEVVSRYSIVVQGKLADGRKTTRRLAHGSQNNRASLEEQFAAHKLLQRVHAVKNKRWEAAENRKSPPPAWKQLDKAHVMTEEMLQAQLDLFRSLYQWSRAENSVKDHAIELLRTEKRELKRLLSVSGSKTSGKRKKVA
jgi:hypothetical protein